MSLLKHLNMLGVNLRLRKQMSYHEDFWIDSLSKILVSYKLKVHQKY